MRAFSYPGTRPITFGVDFIEQLPDEIASLQGDRHEVVLISDAGVARAGVVNRVKSILERDGYAVSVFSDLQGEPKADDVDAATDLVRRSGQPCVVGLGGGSALDVAKLAAVIAGDNCSAGNFALCAAPFPKPALKRILIPTTAGTGSEVTRTAIFTTSQGRKVWAWGDELLPDLVILDPRLTISVPASVTAASGLDALVHAIEACTCKNRNPFSDGLGLHAIRLAKQHLITAIEKPDDLAARGGMLLASTLAGTAFNVTGTAVAHAIGHALASLAGVPHGRAVAISLDATLDWNAPGAPEAHAAVAQALGAPPEAHAAATAFTALMDQSGVARSLAEENIDPETLVAMMMSAENQPMLDNNARPITPDDALELARRTLSRS